MAYWPPRRNVRSGPVGLDLLKLAIQHILVHRQVMDTIGGVDELGFPDRLELKRLHQAAHAVPSDLNTFRSQFFAQATATLALARRVEQMTQLNPRTAMCLRLPSSASGRIQP